MDMKNRPMKWNIHNNTQLSNTTWRLNRQEEEKNKSQMVQ